MRELNPITRFAVLLVASLFCACGKEGTETPDVPGEGENVAADVDVDVDEIPAVPQDAGQDAGQDAVDDGSVVPPSPKDNPGVDVTYLANAGFLLTGPEGDVLIDALFSDPPQPYRAHSGQTLDALTMPRKPFDAVDVVIVTHNHADHYDAEAVAKHMRGNPGAHLITTGQVGADLAEKLPDFAALEDRIHAQTPNPNERIELDVAGMHFTLLLFTHGPNSQSENIGVQFELGGTKILHMGDSLAHLADVEPYNLPEQHIDLLFVPYWMLIRPFWNETIRTGIVPGTIVGTHFEPRTALGKHIVDRGGWDSLFETLQNEFPELVVIEEPASKVHFQ